MQKLEEILGADLYGEVVRALQGKGRDSKDLELAVANDGSFIPKAKFDALCKEYQALKESTKVVEEDLTQLTALRAEKTQLEQALDLATEESRGLSARHQEEMTGIAKEHCLEKALTKYGAKNDIAVKALLNLDKLTMDNGELQGIDEELKLVKEDVPYLFNSELEVFPYQPQGGNVPPDSSQMSDTEYYQFMNRKG